MQNAAEKKLRVGAVSSSFGSSRTASHDPNNGRVEGLLVPEELWNDHKKLIFFPFSSATTCTNRPLEGDQRNPHDTLTQLQWLATSGKLCKTLWLDLLRPCKM
ncbi:hypothetical protein Taro_039886 [Colocasia esculenta]|uniref:Uncharacterized protein n=1 Tax=Colocasia esculenta TaxID=4460 RepID=A0A843WAF8_COLES|nr:hypothetical protein [Colocasia esculenta]